MPRNCNPATTTDPNPDPARAQAEVYEEAAAADHTQDFQRGTLVFGVWRGGKGTGQEAAGHITFQNRTRSPLASCVVKATSSRSKVTSDFNLEGNH